MGRRSALAFGMLVLQLHAAALPGRAQEKQEPKPTEPQPEQPQPEQPQPEQPQPAKPESTEAQPGTPPQGTPAPPPAPAALADSAAAATPEEPALEFRTNVPWARLVLSGRQSIAGRSPLRVPGPILGNFWLTAQGPGVELQRGRVRFSLDDQGSRVYSYGGMPFRQTLIRSVVFPGLAQFRAREPVKGTMLATLGAGGVGLTIWSQSDYHSAEDQVASLGDRLAATTDPDTMAVLTESLLDAQAKSKHLKDRRDLMLKATEVVWGIGRVDGLVFAPRFRVQEADETSMTLSLRTRSRPRALLRSLVFPGLGQEYNGDAKKGFWVGLGGIAAASYLVWRQEDLYRAEAGLEEAETRLAMSPGTENELRRDGRVRDVDDARRDRRRALWIASGYWGLSLVDTALSFQEPWGDVPVEGTSTGTVGWTVDPLHGVFAARLRF